MLDLLIQNGLIVDGTGNAGYFGSVAVKNNTIEIIRGDSSNFESKKIIDATNQVVCPGFIDLHSHAPLTIMSEPHHDPKIRQGVTTELVGIDGISHAPFKSKDDLQRYIWLDSGLNGYPPKEASWLTVPELLNNYHKKVSINIAYILGNAPLRIWSVGWKNEPASKKQILDMKSVMRESMEEGAWGLSTGLDYAPGSFASTDELIEISKVVANMGGFYHTHTRSTLKSKGFLAPYEEAVEIGRQSSCPIHLTHYRQNQQGVGSHLEYLGLVEKSREEGLDVTFDCYTYPYFGTSMAINFPDWTKDGGPERLMHALKNKDDQVKLKSELDREAIENCWLTNFNQPKNKIYEGKTISEISELRSQEMFDTLFEIMHEENLGIGIVGVGTNSNTLPAFVSHPYGMIASDAILFGEFQNPRTYGCFPIVLAEFVRAEKHLKLPEAIRKMTSFPAQRLGLTKRGEIKNGYKADIVIFDPKTVKTHASIKNPKQFPIGINYVIVNGEIVIVNGENTGKLPGEALSKGKS